MKQNELHLGGKGQRLPLLTSLTTLVHQRGLGKLIIKSFNLWRREGWSGIYQRLAVLGDDYKQWVRLFDTLDVADRNEILAHVTKLKHKPLISVLMPTSNSSERWLRQTIESVRTQLYPCWELCIADDASLTANIRTVIEEYIRLDARIRKVYRDANTSVSNTFNNGLEMASGEFVTLLGCQDKLAQHALYMLAVAINEKPEVDMIYSDEDKIDNRGRRFDPFFKPNWDPDLFVARNEVSHFFVYRTSLVRTLGVYEDDYIGWDWGLALRISEDIPATHIYHLPYILYHWRITSCSAAVASGGHSDEKHTTMITTHFLSLGRRAETIPIMDGCFRIKNQVPTPEPLVSIIIPTHNGLSLLSRCIDTIKKRSSYSNYEIIIVDNRSDDRATLEYIDYLEKNSLAQILKYNLPFNYSAINNFAANIAKGEFLCLMNNDIEVISEDWLEEMVSQAARPNIGAVGAMLYYPNNTIQHAGVLVGMGGVAGHLYAGSVRGTHGYKHRACLVQNLSAVTAACLMIKASIYWEVGGLDEKNLEVAFNDVDFCLRVKELGYRNLWTPFAEFYHHESASRGLDDRGEKLQRFQREIAFMHSRWGHALENDDSHNPNLTLDLAYPLPSFPPRIAKPWRK